LTAIGSSLEKKSKAIFWNWIGLRNQAPAPEGPLRSLLVLRPDRLGDFILSVPAIRELEKQLGPSGALTLVAGERNGEMARFLFPGARVLIFRKSLARRLPLFLQLARGAYDAVIDLHSYPFSTTSALMTLLTGSPRRVGFWSGGESADYSRRAFNWGVPEPAENLPEPAKSLLLARRLFPKIHRSSISFPPLPRLPWEISSRVEYFYRGLNFKKGDRVLALHPTLLKVDNRWAPGHYVELIHRLSDIPRLKIVIVHGRGEERELDRFTSALRMGSSVFVLPENQLLFILGAAKGFDLFVGGDSWLTHLAALVTRVAAIFGPSDPQRWGPRSPIKGNPKIFREKDKRCDSVTVEEVEKEIRKMIHRKRTGLQRKT
jgi:ADP-heptose:LPS heptosyltransferase